jgi:homogentisate phytyltransferase / homogentisate geranylgeranyltransferase
MVRTSLHLLVAALLLVGVVCGFQSNIRPQPIALNTGAPSQHLWSSSPTMLAFKKNKSFTNLRAASTVVPTSSASEDAPKPSILNVLWRFTRPHTIIGSAMAIPALHILAAPSYQAAFSVQSLLSMSYAMIPALLMNLYITGLNQVTDVEIDKVNKPYLPIASGDLSIKGGIIAITVSLILSLAMGVASPMFGTEGLNVALWYSAILGTVYSLPPFRLKRFPLLAAFCIVAVRGAVINAGFFAHARVAAFGDSTASVLSCLLTDPRCMLSSFYFAVFGIVIALMKDVPDVKGDLLSNILTFPVRLGVVRIFTWMHRLLSACFAVVGVSFLKGAWAAATPTLQYGRIVVGIASVMAAMSVQHEALPVNPENSRQVYSFYMHLWKLFYLSYLVLPLAR